MSDPAAAAPAPAAAPAVAPTAAAVATPAVAPAAPAIAPAAGATPSPATEGHGAGGATEGGAGQPASPDAATSILDPAAEPPGAKPPAVDAAAPGYTEFTMPEGFTPDATALGEFTALAAEHNLPQQTAQNMIDLYTNQMAEQQRNQVQRWVETQNAWKAEITALPEIGGTNFTASVQAVVRALDAAPGGAELRQALEFTGAINNPRIFAHFHGWATRMNEGPLVAANSPAPTKKTPGEIVYGNI